MAPWIKTVFINFLPKFLFIKRPQYNFETSKMLLKDNHGCFYPYFSNTNIHSPSRYSRTPSKEDLSPSSLTTGPFGGSCQIHGPIPPVPHSESDDLTAVPDLDMGPPSGIKSPILNNPAFSHNKCPPRVHRSCFCVRFIAEHTKMQEDSTKVLSFLCDHIKLCII
uniref:Uncharacterized protein n=1 Tax=Megaselia scalaris TaxID=36166 RepID=T1GB09_MEGSC